jgi:hypothetical protein
MSKIEIPFNEWSKERLSINSKCATSRNKKYGNPGDTFSVTFIGCSSGTWTRVYRLMFVEKVSLGFVAKFFYSMEGCLTPDEFVKVWNDIHPRKKFDPEQLVWLHVFGVKP